MTEDIRVHLMEHIEDELLVLWRGTAVANDMDDRLAVDVHGMRGLVSSLEGQSYAVDEIVMRGFLTVPLFGSIQCVDDLFDLLQRLAGRIIHLAPFGRIGGTELLLRQPGNERQLSRHRIMDALRQTGIALQQDIVLADTLFPQS